MKNKARFFRCEICGNLVELINDGGGELVCCGSPMTELVPNTEDASAEKHVPVAERKDGKIIVRVGSQPHPMIPEHYIEWIAVVSDSGSERVYLNPNSEPKAEFCDKKDAEVYAYCNLHGLWKSEIK